MALQPPSFFQSLNKDAAKQDSLTTGTAGQSPLPPVAAPVSAPASSSNQQQSFVARYPQVAAQDPVIQLPVSPSVVQYPVGTHLPSNTSHLLSPSVQPALLANDLLQVEAHLQSKLRLLENEKRELTMQVLELERTLVQERKQREEEKAIMVAQHEEKLQQIQAESDCLNEEYQSYKRVSENRVSKMEEELTAVQKQHATEVESLQARVTELDQRNASLTSDLHHQSQSHEEELNQLRKELEKMATDSLLLRQEMEKQIETLNSQLSQKSQQVLQLESYLGGEIPTHCGSTGSQADHEAEGNTQKTMTWKEEREMLYGTIRNHERDLQRLQSEDQLLNIRLTSMTEILNIQEADIAKQYKAGPSEVGGQVEDGTRAVRSLLSRWREKVFVLLVQQRLEEMKVNRDRQETRNKEVSLLEQVEQLKREKELLSYNLTDRSAELQRQTNRIQDTEQSLAEAYSSIAGLRSKLEDQYKTVVHLNACLQSLSDTYGSYQNTFNQVLTRIANYEQRLNFTTGRLNSLKATVSCHYAIVQSYTQTLVSTAECGCQTTSEGTPIHQGPDLTSYSREQLVQEVRCLSHERDKLASRLQEGTDTFQKQIESLTHTCNSKLSKLEGRLEMSQRDRGSLESQLSELQQEHTAMAEQRETLHERVEQLEMEMRDTQSTVESRVECAVLEEQGKHNEEMAEMEKLLNVARREHAKAVVQLQQLQRSLDRDRDRAVEAVEMSKARVEHELETCTKKLQATQVERNLLLTTLRQEGLVPPTKHASPRQRDVVASEVKDQRKEIMFRPTSSDSEDTRSVTETTQSCESVASEGSTRQEDSQLGGSENDCHHDVEESAVYYDEETPLPHQHGGSEQQGEIQPANQDIRVVLKDLQMLSASLLGMESDTNQ